MKTSLKEVVRFSKNIGTGLAVCAGLFTAILTASAKDWSQTGAPSSGWTSISGSADGSKLVATSFGGGIYTSTDWGTNWTLTGAPITNWICAASSADGS